HAGPSSQLPQRRERSSAAGGNARDQRADHVDRWILHERTDHRRGERVPVGDDDDAERRAHAHDRAEYVTNPNATRRATAATHTAAANAMPAAVGSDDAVTPITTNTVWIAHVAASTATGPRPLAVSWS